MDFCGICFVVFICFFIPGIIFHSNIGTVSQVYEHTPDYNIGLCKYIYNDAGQSHNNKTNFHYYGIEVGDSNLYGVALEKSIHKNNNFVRVIESYTSKQITNSSQKKESIQIMSLDYKSNGNGYYDLSGMISADNITATLFGICDGYEDVVGSLHCEGKLYIKMYDFSFDTLFYLDKEYHHNCFEMSINYTLLKSIYILQPISKQTYYESISQMTIF